MKNLFVIDYSDIQQLEHYLHIFEVIAHNIDGIGGSDVSKSQMTYELGKVHSLVRGKMQELSLDISDIKNQEFPLSETLQKIHKYIKENNLGDSVVKDIEKVMQIIEHKDSQ
jgi:hypothetical protein